MFNGKNKKGPKHSGQGCSCFFMLQKSKLCSGRVSHLCAITLPTSILKFTHVNYSCIYPLTSFICPRPTNGSTGKRKTGSKKSSLYSPEDSDMVWFVFVWAGRGGGGGGGGKRRGESLFTIIGH